jgi:anti-sigma regulatory factor (Ser/Thr protein kinase)
VAVETQDIAVGTGEHVVQFYEHDAELVAEFAAERDSPGRARHLVVAALREWGHDETLVENAALVLSELATNAVVHAGSPFSVTVHVNDSTLRVAVRDARPLAATVSEEGLIEEGLIPRTGHGLGLIDEISTRWGVESTPDGKVVWAELPCEPLSK